jgi:methionine sulfoxide reductase catalytic subunit
MDRRKFLDVTARGGAAAAAWVTTGLSRAGKLLGTPAGSPLPALPPSPLSSVTTQRKLIIPSDTPDRFKAKVMEFNPILAPDPATWELEIGGLVERPMKLRLADVKRLPRIKQNSRMKCVQCWSARIEWQGFRCGELLRLARPKAEATWVRIDCADMYYDYIKMPELLHPRVLFALGMNGEPLTPEHGAPLRLVMPFKYGYKSSKLITKLTLTNKGGQGVVADTWPYYSQTGDIEAGYDHPFDFPGETRKIQGGEIMDY